MTSLALVAACFAAACYGALHNQISYTVSPEYFHNFKFHQFDFPERLHTRVGASLVGILASWWMGLIIGIPIVRAPWRYVQTGHEYAREITLVFALVIGTALTCSLGALACAYLVYSNEYTRAIEIYSGYPIMDSANFMRAGFMHNCSYIGGIVGLAAGIVGTAIRKRKALET